MLNRYTSTDTLGRPVNIYWPWGMDLKWAVTIAPAEGLDYSLSGKEITLRIQKKTDATGVYLLDQDTTDGNITVDELTISVNIPAADIVAAGIEEGGEYDFSLTIGDPIDGNRIQAGFIAVQETGQVSAGCGGYEVGLSEVSVTVEVIAGADGVPGLIGPAGPWETTARLVVASGAILATDRLLIAEAGENDIELSCPEPGDLWDGVNGRVIVVSRKWDDTGTVTIIGPADGLPLELFSSPGNGGESIWITTYDGVSLVVGDAPFVVQAGVGGAAAGGYLELGFVASDLVDGGVPLPVSLGTVPVGSLVKNVIVRFDEYFDTEVALSVGQAGNYFLFFYGNEPADPEGYLSFLFRKFAGELLIFPSFTSAPTIGSGTIYLTY